MLRVFRAFRDSDDKRIHLTQENIKQDGYDSQMTDLFSYTSSTALGNLKKKIQKTKKSDNLSKTK